MFPTWVFILFIVVAGGLLLWWLIRQRQSRGVGFREWVRDPSHRKHAEEMFRQRDDLVATLAAQPPEAVVQRLLDDDENVYDIVRRALTAQGDRATSSLLAALDDPAFRRKISERIREQQHPFLRRTEPLESVLDCLEETAPVDAVPKIAQLVHDPDETIRRAAAGVLGRTGHQSAVAPLTVALSDEDDSVRRRAFDSISASVRSGRAEPDFRDRILPHVQQAVFAGGANEGSAACLIALDRDRAAAWFSEPGRLDIETTHFRGVIEEIAEADLEIEPAVLLRLATALESNVEQRAQAAALADLYRLLANVGSDEARDAIERGRRSKLPRVRAGAIKAVMHKLGLTNASRYLIDLRSSTGIEGMTEPQRAAFTALQLKWDVSNGGFAQYFVNPAGNDWRHTLKGLDAIGAMTDLAILNEALAFFGPDGPSPDHDTRHEQLSRLMKKNGDEVFGALDSRFYEDPDQRDALLDEYIIRHPADFTPPPGWTPED